MSDNKNPTEPKKVQSPSPSALEQPSELTLANANDERDPQANVDKPSEPRAKNQLVDCSPQGENSSEGAAKSLDRDSTANSLLLNAPEPNKHSGGTYPQALNLVPSSSESSLAIWSFEQIAVSRADAPRRAPNSEQTVKQSELIKQLVEEQEKETKEKLEKQWKEVGGQEGSRPVAETSFAKAIDEIREVIRKAYQELQQRLEENKQIKDKSDKSDKWYVSKDTSQ